jgi:hypothetical protein
MRFRDTKNWCFNLNISDNDLVDLAYSGLPPHLKEKLESHTFFDISQILERALNCAELRSLEVSLGITISLETSDMLTWLSIVASHHMTKKATCV